MNTYESKSNCEICGEEMIGSVKARSRYHADCFIQANEYNREVMETQRLMKMPWR